MYCNLNVFRVFQKLDQDDDDVYLNSAWADRGSLKRNLQNLDNITWKSK